MRTWIAGMSWVLAAAACPLVAGAADCDALAHPAVAQPATAQPEVVQPPAYLNEGVRPADIAQAGVGSLDAAVGTQISNRTSPAWLAIPPSLAAPDSSIAWIFGLGFLGFVVVRRVSAGTSY